MSVSGGGADGGSDGGDGDDVGGLLGEFASFEGGDSFRTMPSIDIRLFDLLTAIVGGLVFAAFDVVIRLVSVPFQILASLFEGLSSFLTQLVQALFGIQGAFQVAFLAARAEIIGQGLAAIVLAALVVAAASYAWGVVIGNVVE